MLERLRVKRDQVACLETQLEAAKSRIIHLNSQIAESAARKATQAQVIAQPVAQNAALDKLSEEPIMSDAEICALWNAVNAADVVAEAPMPPKVAKPRAGRGSGYPLTTGPIKTGRATARMCYTAEEKRKTWTLTQANKRPNGNVNWKLFMAAFYSDIPAGETRRTMDAFKQVYMELKQLSPAQLAKLFRG